MQRRWRAGAVLIGVVVIAVGACDAGEMVADAMVDAAEVLRDGASDDARAQPPALEVITAELACDVVREEVEHRQSDSVEDEETRFTYWYAELTDPAITPAEVRAVSVLGCDAEIFAPPAPNCVPCDTCVPVVTCTGDPPLEPLPCAPIAAEVGDGVVRALCGRRESTRLESPRGSGMFNEWSTRPGTQRFRNVRVSIVIE